MIPRTPETQHPPYYEDDHQGQVERHPSLPRFQYIVDAHGCHLWQRAKNNRGYGVIYFDGKLRLAHRVAWFLHFGDWPDPRLVTDHICQVKACVNVAHLRELPNHLNLRRAYARGDAQTEHRRAQWRSANAKRRGTYRYDLGV